MSPEHTSKPSSDLDVMQIVKQSLRTLWNRKSLWFFGLFVAGAGGGAGSKPGGSVSHATSTPPSWLVPVLITAVVLAVGVLVLHVLSEAALIDGVRRANDGQPTGIGAGLRNAKPHFGRVVCLKALAGATFAAVMTAIAVPALLAISKVVPLPLGVGLSAMMALAGVPVLLTIYFVYVFALRIAVIEDVPALEAVRRARIFVHGRLSISVELLVAWYLGAVVCGAAAAVALVPAAVVAGVCYLAAGEIAAIIGGGAIMIPVALASLGALGTYRSSVWTLGYLQARQAV